jgi:hypothetical protein
MLETMHPIASVWNKTISFIDKFNMTAMTETKHQATVKNAAQVSLL